MWVAMPIFTEEEVRIVEREIMIEWRAVLGGRHFLYAYNCNSPNDEFYDLDSEDAVNLISMADHKTIRNDMIRKLGDALQSDPRWVGYWAEFRVARYSVLPKTSGDMQLFTKPT
jgi:hypothetical protein